jgi:hypothetical protein
MRQNASASRNARRSGMRCTPPLTLLASSPCCSYLALLLTSATAVSLGHSTGACFGLWRFQSVSRSSGSFCISSPGCWRIGEDFTTTMNPEKRVGSRLANDGPTVSVRQRGLTNRKLVFGGKVSTVASISAESVEFWSGSFFIGDGSDSTRRAARRRERASPFCFFQARFPQAHGRLNWLPDIALMFRTHPNWRTRSTARLL